MTLVRATLTCLVIALAAAGCNDPRSSAQPTTPPPPPEVGITTVSPRPIAVVRDLPGRIAPTRIADVRARVGGLVVKRFFEQGSHVTTGDQLYQIDPAFFEAELESAEAEVARSEASLMLARQQSERFRTLLDREATSKAQYETAYATMKQSEASLASAKAAHTRARLNLEYTTVRAPISGRIGRAILTEGALVEQGANAVLATIQQLDPSYVDITQSVGELRKLRRDLASGELSRIAPDVATVRLLFEDGSLYGPSGRLLFSEATADPTTGQVTLRVEIPNAQDELLPGMYVRARIEQAIDSDAIAVPQQAVQRNSDGLPEVFVVNGDDTITVKPIVLGDVVDGLWVVRDGLNSGDRVVVDGFQRITSGAKVRTTTVDEKKLTALVPRTSPSTPAN